MNAVELSLFQKLALSCRPDKAVPYRWRALFRWMEEANRKDVRFVSNGWIGRASFEEREIETAFSVFTINVCHVSAYSVEQPGRLLDGYLCVEKGYRDLYSFACAIPENASNDTVAKQLFSAGLSIVDSIPLLNIDAQLDSLAKRLGPFEEHRLFRRYHGKQTLLALHLLLNDILDQCPQYRVGMDLMGMPVDFSMTARELESDDEVMRDYWTYLLGIVEWSIEQRRDHQPVLQLPAFDLVE